jgi:2-keto-4-pentenoate hydratase
MTASVQDAAARIISEHDRGAEFSLLDDERKGDLAFAYAVQDAVLAQWTPRFGAIAGWKAGLTTRRMQQLCGVSQPIAGAILASRIHPSPATVRAAGFVRFGLETELSFRVAEAPPPGVELTADNVRRFLDVACASFELIEDRAADYSTLDAASMIADNSWNGGMVRGEPLPIDGFAELTGIRGVLQRDGEEVDAGMTEDVGGNPLAIVAWVGNSLAKRGRSLEPGQWIMTGSVVPTRFANANEHYRFTLDGFAPVSLDVT